MKMKARVLWFCLQVQRSLHMDKSDVLRSQHYRGPAVDRAVWKHGADKPQVSGPDGAALHVKCLCTLVSEHVQYSGFAQFVEMCLRKLKR